MEEGKKNSLNCINNEFSYDWTNSGVLECQLRGRKVWVCFARVDSFAPRLVPRQWSGSDTLATPNWYPVTSQTYRKIHRTTLVATRQRNNIDCFSICVANCILGPSNTTKDKLFRGRTQMHSWCRDVDFILKTIAFSSISHPQSENGSSQLIPSFFGIDTTCSKLTTSTNNSTCPAYTAYTHMSHGINIADTPALLSCH